ncbi:hypothetical protein [Streptomyces griseoluteus]
MLVSPPPDHAADGSIREQVLDALDFSYCQGLGYSTPEELLAAYDASRAAVVAPPPGRAALRERVAAALHAQMPGCGHDEHGNDCGSLADAVLAVLPESGRAATLLDAAEAVAALREKTDVHVAVYPRYDARQKSALSDAEALLRRLAAEAPQPDTEARHVPVPLATTCAYCGHRFDEHNRFGCCVGTQEARCGCGAFVMGEKPPPMDPKHILGIDAEPAPAVPQPAAATAYGDGKGRAYCLNCAPTVGTDVPLTIEDVDEWDLCPSCGRHVIDVARAVAQPAADGGEEARS